MTRTTMAAFPIVEPRDSPSVNFVSVLQYVFLNRKSMLTHSNDGATNMIAK